MITKGAQTRNAILQDAFELASELGLEGLTLGKLADRLQMSKSGVFAHFRSREDLQLAVLDYAAHGFVEQVLQSALSQPRGLDRLRALVHNWFGYLRPGRACIFVSAASEYDDRPGPLRQALADMQRRWRADLSRCIQHAIDKQQLPADTDPEQMAFEIFGLVLALHHDFRLLDDDGARTRASRGLERILGVQQHVGGR